MRFCQRTHKTQKYHPVTAELPFTVKTIDCMHHTGRSILQYVTPALDIYQIYVTVSVCVSKTGVVLHQGRRKT